MNSTPVDRIAGMLTAAEVKGERFESHRKIPTPAAIDDLRASFPGIPEDYLAYLQGIGSGSLLSCSYTIYSVPIKPVEVFGVHDEAWPEDMIAFGDNFSGDLGVFEPSSGWAVGELWHEDRSIVRSDKTFAEFMEALISDLTRDD
jgi:hypothetical protein